MTRFLALSCGYIIGIVIGVVLIKTDWADRFLEWLTRKTS